MYMSIPRVIDCLTLKASIGTLGRLHLHNMIELHRLAVLEAHGFAPEWYVLA
jgi:hypothetical protein